MEIPDKRKLAALKIDYDEGYSTDTILEALDQELACYHLCRISSIYLAKLGYQHRLTKDEEYSTFLKLLQKVFGTAIVDQSSFLQAPDYSDGSNLNSPQQPFVDAISTPVPKDYGWLMKQSFTRGAPINLFSFMEKFYEKSFDKKIFSRETLGAFRLAEFLDPFVERSLTCSILTNSSFFCNISLPNRFLMLKSSTINKKFHEDAVKMYKFKDLTVLHRFPTFIINIIQTRGSLIVYNEKISEVRFPLKPLEFYIVTVLQWIRGFSNSGNTMSKDNCFKFNLDYKNELEVNASNVAQLFYQLFENDKAYLNMYSFASKSVALQFFIRFCIYIFTKADKSVLDIFIESVRLILFATDNVSLYQLKGLSIILLVQRAFNLENRFVTDFRLFFKSIFPIIERGMLYRTSQPNARFHHLITLYGIYVSPINSRYLVDRSVLLSDLQNFSIAFSSQPLFFKKEKYHIVFKKAGSKQLSQIIDFSFKNFGLLHESLFILAERFTESIMIKPEVELFLHFFGFTSNNFYSLEVLVCLQLIWKLLSNEFADLKLYVTQSKSRILRVNNKVTTKVIKYIDSNRGALLSHLKGQDVEYDDIETLADSFSRIHDQLIQYYNALQIPVALFFPEDYATKQDIKESVLFLKKIFVIKSDFKINEEASYVYSLGTSLAETFLTTQKCQDIVFEELKAQAQDRAIQVNTNAYEIEFITYYLWKAAGDNQNFISVCRYFLDVRNLLFINVVGFFVNLFLYRKRVFLFQLLVIGLLSFSVLFKEVVLFKSAGFTISMCLWLVVLCSVLNVFG